MGGSSHVLTDHYTTPDSPDGISVSGGGGGFCDGSTGGFGSGLRCVESPGETLRLMSVWQNSVRASLRPYSARPSIAQIRPL